MVMKLRSRQFGWTFRLVEFLFATALLIASLTPSWALAQSTDNPWDKPVNLTHSGIATKPEVVIDSDGVIHVIWQDDHANFAYTELNGDQWSAPVTTNLNRLFRLPDPTEPVDPLQLANYAGPNPVFIASPEQCIFAFWISPEGRVNISNVENEYFKDNTKWGFARLITLGAASFAAGIDARGDLHVAFLRTEDNPVNPPGVYYTRSKTNGGDWSKPVLLYQSSYFRGLEEGEASLSLATAGTEDAPQVYVAWDNRRRKEVFLAQSTDGGQSWGEPALVAGPAPDSGLAGPFNILVGSFQDSVVLAWQNGQPGGACSLISKYSSDAGVSWSNPQPMIEDLLGCAQSNEFVTRLPNSSEGQLYFLAETKS
jgi:hypothetical protein